MRVWIPNGDGERLLAGLPPGVVVDVWSRAGSPPVERRDVTLVVPSAFGALQWLADLPELPSLRVVQLLSVGYEGVVEAIPPGVALCNAAGVYDTPVAEWVLSVILADCRSLPRALTAQAQGTWERFTARSLAGSNVLLVGYGGIGAAVERRLQAFDVRVSKVARTDREGVGTLADLPELLPNADVVVLAVPAEPTTVGLVDRAFLERMRDGALLVNASRGGLVNTDALIAELMSGRLRAALDVTDPEPLPADHPLWRAPGLILTPHIAGDDAMAVPRAYALVARQITHLLRGEPVENAVNR